MFVSKAAWHCLETDFIHCVCFYRIVKEGGKVARGGGRVARGEDQGQEWGGDSAAVSYVPP